MKNKRKSRINFGNLEYDFILYLKLKEQLEFIIKKCIITRNNKTIVFNYQDLYNILNDFYINKYYFKGIEELEELSNSIKKEEKIKKIKKNK